jgi:mitogen-activated protein kinase 1/3
MPSSLFVGIMPAVADGKGDCATWFTAHDLDGDGKLSEEEYRGLLLSVGTEVDKLHPKYVEHVLAQTKRGADGSVTLLAFSEVYERLQNMDRLLRAPRKAASSLPSATSLVASSRVAQRSSISLPHLPCSAHPIGRGERRTPFVLPERYSKLEPIGEGAYGVLVLATDALAPPGASRQVAIKRVRPTTDALQLRCCLRELAILRHIRNHPHPNLLGLRSVVPPPGGKVADWRELYFVTELHDTDLRALIKSSQKLSEEHIRFFTWQLLRGLYALHSMGVIHRDIKPSNLLVNANCDLRIADFGIARGIGPTRATAAAAAARAAASEARAHFSRTNGCAHAAGENNGTGPAGAATSSAEACAAAGGGPLSGQPSQSAAAPAAPHGAHNAGAAVASCPTAADPSHAAPARHPLIDARDDDDGLFTSYAVTRWYRPPELLCGNKRYGPSVDVWSAGCVLAELLGRAPLFSEKDHMEMLRAVLKQLGTPSAAALSRIMDPRAVRFLQRLPAGEKRPWQERLPGCPEPALHLLDCLVRFDPCERAPLESALRHEWLLPLATSDDTTPLPTCHFDFEGMLPNLDHFYLAALDAAAETNADVGYSFRLPEMLRFGILHDRTVYPLDERPVDQNPSDDDGPLFPSGSPDTEGEPPPVAA